MMNPPMPSLNKKPSSAFTQLGGVARDCLAPGQCGKILAVFSKAIYLLTETDALFWITTDEAPMHRRCAQISPPLPGPLAGSPFRVEDRRLTIDPDFIFDIDSASSWDAPRLDPNAAWKITELPERIHSLFSRLDFSQAGGCGNFIPLILSLTRSDPIEPFSKYPDPILQFSQPFVLDMARACLESQPSRISQTAGKLIGLGTGLTPSGDDFVGGFLFAVNQLQAAFPAFDFTPYAIPVEGYAARTPSISFTLLKDHTDGHAIAPLHRIINALISGEPLEGIHPFISQLTQIGHSTGWDLLTGLLTGLLLANH